MSGGLCNCQSEADAARLNDAFIARCPTYRTASVKQILDAQVSLIGDFPGRYGGFPFRPCFGELIKTELCQWSLDILIGIAHKEFALFIPQTRLYPAFPRLIMTEYLSQMG